MKSREVKYGTLCYLCVDGKVLMIQKDIREGDPNSGYCTPPGGKLKISERGTLMGRLEGMLRELEEETGFTMIGAKFIGEIFFDNSERTFDNWDFPKDYHVYVFRAEGYSGKLKERCKEGVPLWVDKETIPSLPQNPGDSKMYEWINSGRRFKGTIKHKGKILDESGTRVEYY
ncbi:MAG TPA: NUDIX domain-containing protein [Candidatus Brocadiales bacterium]|nr:NUDIX domain-containing protein [Candidatus Brocadiales bacterium]